jgi:hypothetical protein
MTIELPVLRLGLAGFSTEQQERLGAALARVAPAALVWEAGKLADADAWWVNGARAQTLPDGTVRVPAGCPTERSLQLNLPDIDRPVAFSLPLACTGLSPLYTFDAASPDSMSAVLEKFEAWFSPMIAEYALASHIVEHHAALGNGAFDVVLEGRSIAVVNMRGEIGVLPGASPTDFEDASWSRRPSGAPIPENFARTDLSQLMWQYSVRTQRDLLPRHYRTGLLYFRRPPRLQHRVLQDSHLLIMRELAREGTSFEALRQRCGLHGLQLARDLAALYFVGAITSNPKRAAPSQGARRPDEAEPSQNSQTSVPSGLDSMLPVAKGRRPVAADLTAPAPMGRR